MPRFRILMRDCLVLDPKQYRIETKMTDAKKAPTSLLLRVPATHAAVINGNRRWYRPDKMADSCHTWLENGYPKPVLVAHDEKGAPIGRVIDAKYVDLSWKYKTDFPIINDSVFYSSDADTRADLFETIEWITDNLCDLDDYEGLGFIELGLQITDPDAIQKVLRKEYLTVSVGFSTDSAICSVCHQDWAEDDKCKHKLGKMYDGKTMFLVTGDFNYRECSFVNVPADPFAKIASVTEMTDSLDKFPEYFLGLTPAQQAALAAKAGVEMTDGLFLTDIQVLPIEKGTKMDLSVYKEKFKTVQGADAVALRAELDSLTPETDEDKRELTALKSNLTVAIKKNNWKAEDTKPAETSEDVAAAVTDAGTQGEVNAAETDKEIAAALTDGKEAKETKEGDADGKCKDCGKDCKDCTCEKPAKKDEAGAPAALKLSDELTAVLTKAGITFTDANEGCISALNALDAAYKGLPDNDKGTFRLACRAQMDVWYAQGELEFWKSSLCAEKDHVLVAKDEYTNMQDAVVKLDEEVKSLNTKRVTDAAERDAVLKLAKKAYATALVLNSAHKGQLKDMTVEQITAEISEKASRGLASLKDSLNDVLAELKWVVKPAEATSDAKVDEPQAKEVSDNAQVTDPAQKVGKQLEGKDSQEEQHDTGLSAADEQKMLSMMSRQERTEYLSRKRFALNTKAAQ